MDGQDISDMLIQKNLAVPYDGGTRQGIVSVNDLMDSQFRKRL